jgi:hypothetical protein
MRGMKLVDKPFDFQNSLRLVYVICLVLKGGALLPQVRLNSVRRDVLKNISHLASE